MQAYLLWEKAGQPEGADFGDEARRIIEDRVRSGATYPQLAREMNIEPSWGPQPQQQKQQQAAPAEAAPSKPKEAVVGEPLGTPARNPLDMIKVGKASRQAAVGRRYKGG